MSFLYSPGTYQCVAENEVGVAYSDVVSVRRAVMAYVPKQEPRVVTATLGRPLRLDCDAPAGHPTPSVQWFLQVSECAGCAAHLMFLGSVRCMGERGGGGGCGLFGLSTPSGLPSMNGIKGQR